MCGPAVMTKPDHRVTVQNRQRACPVDGAAVRALTLFVLAHEGLPAGAGATVRMVSDAGMRVFNARYFGKTTPTDVISFPSMTASGPDAGGAYVGDVVVSVEQARRYARAHALEPAVELARYVIHGLLHCLGYDDVEPRARRRMLPRQEALLRAWRRQPACRSILKLPAITPENVQ